MALLLLPSKEAIKVFHAKSMIFVAQSWAMMLLFNWGRCSVEFFWFRLIVIWCFWHHWCKRHEKIMCYALMASAQRAWESLLLSWVLMLLCTCISFSTEFLLFSMIVICLIIVVVIAIKRSDQGCSCLADCCHPNLFILLT